MTWSPTLRQDQHAGRSLKLKVRREDERTRKVLRCLNLAVRSWEGCKAAMAEANCSIFYSILSAAITQVCDASVVTA